MIDLTKIREPFGLLDEATQKALRKHGGPYERYGDGGKWVAKDNALTFDGTEVFWKEYTYRVKPKLREWWIVFEDESFFHSAHTNEADAKDAADAAELTHLKIIHVREVI